MPNFKEPNKLAKHESYSQAIESLEAGLRSQLFGVSQVYKVDVPGKDETVYGILMTEGDGADERVMSTCDTGPHRRVCYLPLEIMVSGAVTYGLAGKFRIALSFPDLAMGTFMKIVGAPGDIQKREKAVANNKK